MVVTTGVRTRSAVRERKKIIVVVDQVKLRRPLKEMGDMQALPDLGVNRRILFIRPGADKIQFALVMESPVANRVTSIPVPPDLHRAGKPSAPRDHNAWGVSSRQSEITEQFS